jgi:hypothetical protein
MILMIPTPDDPPQWFTKGLVFPCHHCLTKYQDTQATDDTEMVRPNIHTYIHTYIHMQSVLATKCYLLKSNPVCLRGLNKVTYMHV